MAFNIIVHGSGSPSRRVVFRWNGMGDGQEHRFRIDDHNESITLGEDDEFDIELTELTFVPAAGWNFDHMEIRQRYDFDGEIVERKSTVNSHVVCTLPDGGHITDHFTEKGYNHYTHELMYTWTQTTVQIDIYCTRQPKGIIFSPTVNPGKIIYDLATGRPMVYT